MPVRAVPENAHVSTVRNDVINNGCRLTAPRHCASVMDFQKRDALAPPLAVIAAFAGCRTIGVMAGVTLTPTLDLTGAIRAGLNYKAA